MKYLTVSNISTMCQFNEVSTTAWLLTDSMLYYIGNQMRDQLIEPTDFEMAELQAEYEAEMMTIQRELDADEWVELMMKDIQY